MVQSIFEEMGGRYERQGEYILPCLTIPPEKEQSIDLFGRRHLDYLREYRKITSPPSPICTPTGRRTRRKWTGLPTIGGICRIRYGVLHPPRKKRSEKKKTG